MEFADEHADSLRTLYTIKFTGASDKRNAPVALACHRHKTTSAIQASLVLAWCHRKGGHVRRRLELSKPDGYPRVHGCCSSRTELCPGLEFHAPMRSSSSHRIPFAH